MAAQQQVPEQFPIVVLTKLPHLCLPGGLQGDGMPVHKGDYRYFFGGVLRCIAADQQHIIEPTIIRIGKLVPIEEIVPGVDHRHGEAVTREDKLGKPTAIAGASIGFVRCADDKFFEVVEPVAVAVVGVDAVVAV